MCYLNFVFNYAFFVSYRPHLVVEEVSVEVNSEILLAVQARKLQDVKALVAAGLALQTTANRQTALMLEITKVLSVVVRALAVVAVETVTRIDPHVVLEAVGEVVDFQRVADLEVALERKMTMVMRRMVQAMAGEALVVRSEVDLVVVVGGSLGVVMVRMVVAVVVVLVGEGVVVVASVVRKAILLGIARKVVAVGHAIDVVKKVTLPESAPKAGEVVEAVVVVLVTDAERKDTLPESVLKPRS